MSYKLSDVLWEGKRFWVLRGKRHTQIMKTGVCTSESIETYKAGADGESIAIARAKYLDMRASEKAEAESQQFRLDRPELFAYRVLAYLSRYGGSACWPAELREIARAK